MYQVLKQDLEEMIRKGDLLPGEKVPSESELIARYKVSNTTARRCLDELQAAGWLERKRGKGTFVSRMATRLHRERVALVVKDFLSLAHPFLATVVGTLEHAFESAGVHVVIVRAKPSADLEEEGQHLADVLEHENCRHAVILSNLPLRMLFPLLERNVCCLGVNTRYLDDRIPHVATDFAATRKTSFMELASRGHKHIAVLAEEPAMADLGVMNSSSMIEIAYDGVRRIFSDLDEHPLLRMVGEGNSLSQIVDDLMNGDPVPTAFVCWDELNALDLIRCLSDRSIRVPQDVSVIGSKLLPVSPVACVDQPLELMARQAVEAMMSWMQGVKPSNRLLGPVGFLPRETISDAPNKL